MSELEQLTALCQRLGAEAKPAATMAAQLLKRADQLVIERGMERMAALSYLIELMVKARNGESPPQFPPTSPPGM